MGLSVDPTTYLNLISNLRISGAVLLTSLHDVMLRAAQTSPFIVFTYTQKRKFIYWVFVPLQEGMPSERCESALVSFLLRTVAEILITEFQYAVHLTVRD
jgi:hypothetical protein